MIRCNGIAIDVPNRTITHRSRVGQFKSAKNNIEQPAHRFKIMAYLILGGGVSKQQIFWHLYANDSEGGPLEGTHVIDIVFCQLKAAISELDLEMRATKVAGITFYELVPIFRIVPMSQPFRNIKTVRNRKARNMANAAH